MGKPVKLTPAQQKAVDHMADGFKLVQYKESKKRACLQLRGINNPKTNVKCSKATVRHLEKVEVIGIEKDTKTRVTYKLIEKKEPEKAESPNHDSETGNFAKGNNAWERRAKTGRNKLFDDADVLWEAAKEYFDWIVDNPLQEEKVFVFQGIPTHTTVNKMQAMTLDGLTMFLGIGLTTWADYKKRDDFSWVTEDVETIIRNQKFTGAAADLLNANIIARDLGLKDSSSTELTGVNGGAIVTQNLDSTPEEIYKAMLEANKAVKK